MSMLAEAPEAYKAAARRDAVDHSTKRSRHHAHRAEPKKMVALVDFRRPTGAPQKGNRHVVAAAWPDESAALEYAAARLAQLKTEHDELGLAAPSVAAEERMLQVLRAVLATDSVFPTMSIDDDGSIIAEWRFLRHGLEIVAEPDGDVSYALRKAGHRIAEGTSTTLLRRIIRDITVLVDGANPNWRSLFRDVDTHSR